MPDSDPASTLRRAASVLRERGQAATPGPWEMWPLRGVDGCAVRALSGDRHVLEDGTDADQAWLCAVHPSLAAPLADWLDSMAWHVEVYEARDGERYAAHALAVARVVLGEDGQ